MSSKMDRLFQQHKLRRTHVREQVMQVFIDAGSQALTNNDLEKKLENADRITLYRTLKTFEKKGIIHQAVDGGQAAKYALCIENCSEHEHHDEHAHFHCESCDQTVCVDTPVPPTATIPAGYQVKSMHLVLSGLCNECA